MNHFRTQDCAALSSKLVIVVVGIFVAIQADRWWQHQDEIGYVSPSARPGVEFTTAQLDALLERLRNE